MQSTPFHLAARILVVLLTLALLPSVRAQEAAPAHVPVGVRLALEQARIPPHAVALWVQAVDGRAPSLAVNADIAMNPASVMKLVTAFAAFEALGPSHTWETRFSTAGAVRDRVLHGDLYLVGGADPVLGYERVWKLLRRLRALGIDTIAGDIVLDGSTLILPNHDAYAFDGRGMRPYNAPPHGLLVHYNTLQLALFPAPLPNQPVTVAAEPPLAGLTVDNRLTTSAAACGVWYRDLDARLEPGGRLVLSGSLPASCGPRNWSAAPLPPAEFGVAAVAALWAETGGRLRGRVRTGIAAADARTLLSDESAPLADVVRDMNKWSSNVIARQLIASLGRNTPVAASDSVNAGIHAVHTLLTGASIDTSGLVLENGAGLSRIERVRADHLGQMLITAWQRPWMPEYLAALPVAGLDGTARRRLADSPARGRAHIKTGTIDGVRAVAGYVLDVHGRRHVVVMMVNHAEAAASSAAQDALLEWIWAGAR